jgi:hypothetical protein
MEDYLETNDKAQPNFIFKKERDFGEIISDTFTFFSQNNKRLFNIFVKFIGPFILLLILSSTLYQYKTGDLLSDLTVIGANPSSFFGSLVENLLVMLFYMITTLLTTIVTYLVILHSIKSYINNNGEILDSDISNGIKKDFWKMLGYILLFYIVAFIGFMLCFLPGVYISVVLAPGIAMLIIKDISVGDAFSKCFTIIKDNWWITFATLLVFVILLFILNFIFQLPATIYTLMQGFLAADSINTLEANNKIMSVYSDWIYLLFSAIAVIGQYFMNIFTVIITALIYFNLTEKQEFTGTYEQIDNIGN